jgi:hypothetical protein
MFDFTGKGSLDTKIYFDVVKNEIVSNYRAPISSIYFWKYKNDSTYTMERVVFDTPAVSLTLPNLKDSLDFYDFQVSVHLQDDHWRMMHHITITKQLAEKKKRIYSRFTSH